MHVDYKTEFNDQFTKIIKSKGKSITQFFFQ